MISQHRPNTGPEAATSTRTAGSRNGVRLALIALATVGALAAPATVALAQAPRVVTPQTERIKLSGPRFGVTYLGGKLVDRLAEEDIDIAPLITQFGWQWERQFNVGDTGPTAVSEWVLLVGGLEQGVFLPSLSWIVGLRTKSGTEFGVGPNASAAGFALAIAAGVTRQAGTLNIPFNVSLVPSKEGVRISALTGFTMR